MRKTVYCLTVPLERDWNKTLLTDLFAAGCTTTATLQRNVSSLSLFFLRDCGIHAGQPAESSSSQAPRAAHYVRISF